MSLGPETKAVNVIQPSFSLLDDELTFVCN